MPTPTKKKGKTFRKLLFLLFGSILILIITMENLNTYSIYYEEQLATSEKERRDNVIKTTITNLRSLHHKNIPKMHFDFDGSTFVGNQNDSSTEYYPGISWNGDNYTYFDKKENIYSFNEKLTLTYAIKLSSTEHKVLDLTQLDEEQLKDEMYETIRPIIEAQDKPGFFNLLWLYKLLRK